ncbi:MAG: outer membrane lipid asymmetry maintenance protein MlaD [Alphaproteobacteria bacterium]|nr:outer membrane lipid asymmetry maintenance protein MlaD [Alphaproteobacteria bacterium]
MGRKSLAEIIMGAVVLVVAAGFLWYAVTHTGRSALGGYTLTAKFDRIDGLPQGADVRVAGVKVGSVLSQRIDPQTYLAVVTLSVDPAVRLPVDSSAEITSEGLLGGKYIALVPGGSDRMLRAGQEIENTQASVSLEQLLGRFIFSVSDLVSNTSRQQGQGGGGGASPAPTPAPGGAAPR